jgi:hypothetical protein
VANAFIIIVYEAQSNRKPLAMNEERQVLLHHIYQRLLVFEENVNRLNSEFFMSDTNLGSQFRIEHMKVASEEVKIDKEDKQGSEKQLILALLEKLETLEAELVEIRMVYLHQLTMQNLVLSNRSRNLTITLLKKFPPLFNLMKKLRSFYILKKSTDLNSLNSQTKKKAD